MCSKVTDAPPSALSNMACATLFINPNIDDQVMGRHKQISLKSIQSLSADCDIDL